MFDFRKNGLKKKLTKKFPNLFRVYSMLAKNDNPSTANAPTLLLQNPILLKNVDVCKKLELNRIRFDRDMRILSSKKTFYIWVNIDTWGH